MLKVEGGGDRGCPRPPRGTGVGHPWLTSPLRDWQGQGQEPSATLHIIPDFRESKGDARPCLSCTPSPGALKLPPPAGF